MRITNNPFFRISTLTLALATLVAFTSCSDDDPAFMPNLPVDGGNVVKSIKRTGAIVNTAYDWDLSYDGPRLSKGFGIIRDPENRLDKSHSYTSYLKYGDRALSVSNSSKEEIHVKLNSYNLIDQMNVGQNVYTFQYQDGYLCSWQKVISEDSFGHATKYKSSGSIVYENEDLKSIEFIGPDNVKITTTFVPDVIKNNNGLLPETIANEFGCLGFEHLYYAGLLGKPTTHLVKSLTVSHPKDSTKCYSLNFEYHTSGSNTDLCIYKSPSGRPVSVNYTY